MAEVKKARLFLRRGTDTDRIATTLCEGELGYSTDAFRVVIGDGSTAGGRPVGPMVHVSGGSLALNFQSNLTSASAFNGTGGYAVSGDIAILPAQNYTNAAGSSVTVGSGNVGAPTAATVMVLTGSNAAVNTSWVAVNSGIPWGNLTVQDDDISGDKIHGGVISGPISLSGGDVYIGGNSSGAGGENLILSGVALSAATIPTGDIIYPVGLTSTGALSCIDSIYGFGLQTANTSSNLGNNVGYLAATDTSTTSAVSAYAYTSSEYTIDGSSAYGNVSSSSSTSNGNYGINGTGIDIFTNDGYLGSGGAYASGSGVNAAALPLGWSYPTTSNSSKCKIVELVYDIVQIQNATNKNSSALDWTDIIEFYFSVYYKHYDDAAAFIGHHNHLLNSNQIIHWNGSSISKGKMRSVPEVQHVTIPNTFQNSDAATKRLVVHLGFAAEGSIAMRLTGIRLRN